MGIIECVPNVSEGRRPAVVDALADALREAPGVRLFDYSADPSHNRSVFTFVGKAEDLKAAVLALFSRTVELVDMRRHAGQHPRIGAIDVVPFVPIEGVPMDECTELARQVGAAIADRFAIPVYLYENAAQAPGRQHLEEIRRGGFEGLAAKMKHDEWRPDYGPRTPHPTAGASVVGARPPLIAFNVNLDTDDLDIARQIARVVRARGGGLRSVKALGLELKDRGIVQVSMNLTNYAETPIHRAFEAVRREAARHGVAVLESEVVGLVPAAGLLAAAAHYLQLGALGREQVLETHLYRAQDSRHRHDRT